MARAWMLTVAVMGIAMIVSGAETDLLPLGDPARALELASAPPGAFYDTRAGAEVPFDDMVAAMASSRVILLGEDHTRLEQKLVQARILDALAMRGVHLVLGMEFFDRGDREVLAKWVDGSLVGDEFLLASGWYDRGGSRFDYFRPIMEVARRHSIPIFGLNVPRSIPRTVNMRGLDGLDEAQRREVGEVATAGSPEHRYLIARYFGETVAMLPPGWFDNMYAAQCLWDVVMARSILADLPDDATMVVVVGSGHVAYGLGIARRIADERREASLPPLAVTTYVPVEAPAPDPEGEPSGHPMGGHGGEPAVPPGQFVRSLADVVAVFPATGGIEAFPSLGVQLAAADDGRPKVARVWPDTVAEAVGLTAGDVVLSLDGRAPQDLPHLRLELAKLEWGTRIELVVDRDGKQLAVPMLLFPEVVSDDRSVAPGYTAEPCLPVDPESAAAVTVIDTDAELHAVKVVRKDGPTRVEESVGRVLESVHDLDDNGRVVRSLYRQARPDGSIEISYRRGADGAVVETVKR